MWKICFFVFIYSKKKTDQKHVACKNVEGFVSLFCGFACRFALLIIRSSCYLTMQSQDGEAIRYSGHLQSKLQANHYCLILSYTAACGEERRRVTGVLAEKVVVILGTCKSWGRWKAWEHKQEGRPQVILVTFLLRRLNCLTPLLTPVSRCFLCC